MSNNNSNLHSAKKAKNDEFYTRFYDIEAQMNEYVGYNRDVFRGKTILLPCDDPEWSNFTRYFAANFNRFGLKKLISTSYAKSAGNKDVSLFEMNSPLYDKDKHDSHGKLFTVTGDSNGDKIIDTDDIVFCGYLEGDGDFRSEEVTKLRDEADVIISNPPFSLFREFLDWIIEGDKEFAIIGHKNAIGYKEIFPLLRSNKIWLGAEFPKGQAYFKTPPEEGESFTTEFYNDDSSLVKFGNIGWYTNLDYAKRHDLVIFDTAEHNLVYNKKLRKKLENEYGKIEYPHYDNYDAIEVPFVEAIPCDYEPAISVPADLWDSLDADLGNIQLVTIDDDYFRIAPKLLPVSENTVNEGESGDKLYVRQIGDTIQFLARGKNREELVETLVAIGVPEDKMSWISGVMGVPITFMEKYNPSQFEIVRFRKGDDEKDLLYTAQNGKQIYPYSRILIKHKR